MDRTFDNHFLVFSRTRSGTTVFSHLLNSSSAIFSYDEVLNTKHPFNFYAWLEPQVLSDAKRIYPGRWETNFLEYADHLETEAKKSKPSATTIGWDIKVENSPQYVKEWGATFSLELIDFVTSHGVRIIYLRRKNVLQRHVSNVLAHQRKIFHQTPGSERPVFDKVTIDAQASVRMAVNAFEEDDKIEDYIRGRPGTACFYYEDFFVDTEAGQRWSPILLARLGEHLNVSDLDPEPRLQKVAPRALRDALQNYDEVCETFSRRHVAWMVGE